MTEWATLASALAAAIGLLFAGWQLLLLNRQARYDRRVAYEGVVVSWRPTHSPVQPGEDAVYEVVVHNPGRLPIDDISITWVFPFDVSRVHYNGETDPPTNQLVLVTPVLAGGDKRPWTRTLRMPFEDRQSLKDTYAEVTFTNIDGRRLTNRWPRSRPTSSA